MMTLEGLARYLLELLRVEPVVWTVHFHGQFYGLSISMILGLLISAAGIIIWIFLGRPGRRVT